ncbi:MAG: helicase HerA domain-containing protein, partial [Candidatus Bathyarchaeia archaeon]
MTSPLDLEAKHFTDFDGRFKARLAAVIPTRAAVIDARSAPTTAKYDCRIKVEYNKDLMRLIEEGMLVAVRNFKSNSEYPRKYTLMEISRVYPEHYGLRGLSDHAYYPLQFEVIDQSVADWASDDRSTLMVQISAIPTNYDFIINSDKQPEYVKGFSYPVIGERVHILNKETVDLMYNHKILKKLPILEVGSSVGTMKMFEADPEKVPIYVDFENLVRYHFGIFAFTGGGKSNLVSTLVRKILRTLDDVKVVIFDISQEYPFLLLDVFRDSSISSKIILDSPASTLDEFYASVVKPRGFEEDPRVRKALTGILQDGKVA